MERFKSPATRRRLRYVRYEGSSRQYVYVDVNELGCDAYSAEEEGEVRAHAHQPSQMERDFVSLLRERSECPEGWRAYIDLDVPAGMAAEVADISLAAFREFIQQVYGPRYSVALDRMIVRFVEAHGQETNKCCRALASAT
jgi:hypothetical protein